MTATIQRQIKEQFYLHTSIEFYDGNTQYLPLPTPYDSMSEAVGVAKTICDQYSKQDSASVKRRTFFVVNLGSTDLTPQRVAGVNHEPSVETLEKLFVEA